MEAKPLLFPAEEVTDGELSAEAIEEIEMVYGRTIESLGGGRYTLDGEPAFLRFRDPWYALEPE